MTRDQWERLKALFHGALAQRPEERNGWLAEQTAGDEMLAREASALIAAHETAERFLDVPVDLSPNDLTEAITLERSGDPLGALERRTDPLDALQRDIETTRRAHDSARASTSRRSGRVDQLIDTIVRRVRRLME